MSDGLPASLALPLGMIRKPPASARVAAPRSTEQTPAHQPLSARDSCQSKHKLFEPWLRPLPGSNLLEPDRPKPPASSPPQFRRHRPRAYKPATLAPVKQKLKDAARAPLASMRGQRSAAQPEAPNGLGSRLGGRAAPASPRSKTMRRERSDLEELLPQRPDDLPRFQHCEPLPPLLPSARAVDGSTSPIRPSTAEEAEHRIAVALASYEKTIEQRARGSAWEGDVGPTQREKPSSQHSKQRLQQAAPPMQPQVRSLNSNENRSLHRPKVADAQEDEGVPADSARQLAVDAERLLAQRRERAALAAAAAEARMARNMAMHNTPCEVQGEVLPLSRR